MVSSIPVDTVSDLLASGKSYAQISDELRQQHPEIRRGLSARNIRRYVKENGIKAKIDRQTEETLQAAVSEVRLHAYTNHDHTVVAQVSAELGIHGKLSREKTFADCGKPRNSRRKLLWIAQSHNY